MRLLLTRPMDQSETSAARLRGMGYQVIVTPVLEIVTLPARWPDGTFDGLIATSARAFAALPGSAGFPARPFRRNIIASIARDTRRKSGLEVRAPVHQGFAKAAFYGSFQPWHLSK